LPANPARFIGSARHLFHHSANYLNSRIENGGEKVGHWSGGLIPLRAA
jgi:hypothetical protein